MNQIPLNSPHLYFEAADLRAFDFTSNEQQKLLAVLNTFTYKDGRPVSFIHNIGNGTHFHVQYGQGTSNETKES